MHRCLGSLALLVLLAASCPASSLPEAVVALEVFEPPAPGRVSEAAPPRFVLLPDGTAFVGGTSHLASGRLEKDAIKDLERQVGSVRKLPGLGSSVALGRGDTRYRLTLAKSLTILATGDPSQAPAQFKPLAALFETLLAFSDPALRPFRPTQFLLSAREARIQGGCRSLAFSFPLADAVSAPRTLSAEAASGWPTGASAANVCSGDRTYLVALKPLLPGERP